MYVAAVVEPNPIAEFKFHLFTIDSLRADHRIATPSRHAGVCLRLTSFEILRSAYDGFYQPLDSE